MQIVAFFALYQNVTFEFLLSMFFQHHLAAARWFMYGLKRSMHVHCPVFLSQVLLSQVGSLFFFVLFFMTQRCRIILNMNLLVSCSSRSAVTALAQLDLAKRKNVVEWFGKCET